MSERPSKVKIGPYDMTVGPLDPTAAHQDFGQFCAITQTIRTLDTFSSPQLEAETTLHEILHAIWWAYQAKAKDGEERIVSCLGVGLAQFIRDNPAFTDWLRDKLK